MENQQPSQMKPKKRRRWIALSLVLLITGLGVYGCETAHLWVNTWLHDRPAPHDVPEGHADDASRMNRTRVAEVWSIPADRAAAEVQLRALLERARSERLPVSIAGARHSMGGHTIAPDGIVLDMLPFKHMKLDADRQRLSVGAGARWAEIVPYLDSLGYSVAVMQSNNNFSVGGSLSVNCHGWQHNSPPIASTVQSLRLMMPDGSIARCARDENAELFSLVLGGYGLFGVILDVELRVVPNERYQAEVEVMHADNYVVRYFEKVNTADNIGMVFGRLCVVPGEKTFLREAIMTVFRKAPCPKEEIPGLSAPDHVKLRRQVYRAQIGSDAGKALRWKAEKSLGEQSAKKFFSRNQLLNESAEVYAEQNADRTDILHEYFIPRANVPMFLQKARDILPRHPCDLLNITIRNVLEDKDSFLRYADQEMFAFVMLFNQARTKEADGEMEALTREMIDAAIECGGRYYLPYRLHASREQFNRAYPRGSEFFERKRHYDPQGMFQNGFYDRYGRP
jgi:FAD/FMN-containing dehydrogenase